MWTEGKHTAEASLWGGAGRGCSSFSPRTRNGSWTGPRHCSLTGTGGGAGLCPSVNPCQATHLRRECRWQGQASPASCSTAQGLSLPHTCLLVSGSPRCPGYTAAFFLSFLNFKKFMYLLLAAPGLCCYTWAFSSCSEQGLLSSGAPASHCGGFSCFRAQALVCLGIRSCGLWA